MRKQIMCLFWPPRREVKNDWCSKLQANFQSHHHMMCWTLNVNASWRIVQQIYCYLHSPNTTHFCGQWWAKLFHAKADHDRRSFLSFARKTCWAIHLVNTKLHRTLTWKTLFQDVITWKCGKLNSVSFCWYTFCVKCRTIKLNPKLKMHNVHSN